MLFQGIRWTLKGQSFREVIIMLRTDTGLYHAICEVLKTADQPMTCTELYAVPAIRRYANNANRVSDYLGNLWRDNMLKRAPAPRTEFSSARWAYTWRGNRKSKNIPTPQVQILDLPEYTITIAVTHKI